MFRSPTWPALTGCGRPIPSMSASNWRSRRPRRRLLPSWRRRTGRRRQPGSRRRHSLRRSRNCRRCPRGGRAGQHRRQSPRRHRRPVPPRPPQLVAARERQIALPAIPAPQARSASGFQWPLAGEVVSRFGPKSDGRHNDGVNIAAAAGTPVVAADNGVVAYAGNELRGYGNLVLIRHDGDWVTAYGHAEQLLVSRGDRGSRRPAHCHGRPQRQRPDPAAPFRAPPRLRRRRPAGSPAAAAEAGWIALGPPGRYRQVSDTSLRAR